MEAKVNQQYCKLGEISQAWGNCKTEGGMREGRGQRESSWEKGYEGQESKTETKEAWRRSEQFHGKLTCKSHAKQHANHHYF